jgi:glutamate dehydrogenase/leucine dehydrogenase
MILDTIGLSSSKCVSNAGQGGKIEYVNGANLAGFKKIATAMRSFAIY